MIGGRGFGDFRFVNADFRLKIEGRVPAPGGPVPVPLFFTRRKVFELLYQELGQEVETQPIRLSLFVC